MAWFSSMYIESVYCILLTYLLKYWYRVYEKSSYHSNPINVFILSILLITIMMLDLSNFDDFFNYQYYFNTISDSQISIQIFFQAQGIIIFGSDIGFAYLLKIFSIFGSYETMIS